MEKAHWTRFAVMLAISFAAMYLLMYTMINGVGDFYINMNQVYMAGSMTTAMAAIELAVMAGMYKNAAVRNILIAAAIALTVLLVVLIRYQAGIGNTQFLRSMIPHHSGAILMCNNAAITDPDIKTLCETIVKGQQEEIDRMNAILNRSK